MPLKNYGVWVAYPKSFVAETDDKTPHLELYFDEDVSSNKGKLRAAINIKSSTVNESRLVYWFVRNFDDNAVTEKLGSLEAGFHTLASRKGAPALDYIRGNLFRIDDGAILAHNEPGERNDIIDFISPVLTQAIKRKARIFLFGEQFSDGGRPTGIHDVHMNQGNDGRFARYNGTWQDGGILLYFPDDGHWEGIFLAFGVQSVHTDDRTGNPIGGVDFVTLLENRPTPVPVEDPNPDTNPDPDTDPAPGEGEEDPTSPPAAATGLAGSVFIRAALVNPFGPDQNPTSGSPETVYLLNKSTTALSLAGASIMNRSGGRQALSGSLPGQSSRGFAVPDAPLGNQGGTITVLDARGLKVDGVSYSKAQARREGDLVYFG